MRRVVYSSPASAVHTGLGIETSLCAIGSSGRREGWLPERRELAINQA